MDLEDFQRLGLRPDETRIGVIRSAAIRSAKPLVEQHLRTADQQVEVQLSRIAASAYRLLDPRRREDPLSRIRVGRILPLTLKLVEQTDFVDSTPPSSPTIPLPNEAFHQPAGPSIDMDLQDWLGSEAGDALLDVERLWESGQIGERLLGVPSKPGHPPVAALATVALVASMMMAMLGYLFWFSKQSQPLASHSKSQSAPEEWELSNFTALPLSFAEATRSGDPSSSERSTERARLLALTMADLAPVTPFVWAVNLPKGLTEPGQHPILRRPSRDEEWAARQAFQRVYPELRRLALPGELENQIQVLQWASEKIEPGSVDDWVCQVMMAELSWLSGKRLDAETRLTWIAQRYGVSSDELIVESFEAACRLASLPETHQRLLDRGMPLADRFLVSESFAASRRIVAALVPSAESLEQVRLLQQLLAISDATVQAERLFELGSRLELSPRDPIVMDDQTSSVRRELGVLGRYYCLYLRRWDAGLPWLCEAADSRLASAARRQLDLEPTADFSEVKEVASLWLALASRSEGRVADSLRLHGVEMLEGLLPASSGLEKLKLQRTIQQEQSRLPSYLRRRVLTG
jgi:hypothetical protein